MTHDGKVILQKRESKDWIPNSGKVHVFGGRAEGDEDGRRAMEREIKEETNLTLSPQHIVKLVGQYDELNDKTGLMDNPWIYLISFVEPEELQVLEGESHVVIGKDTDLNTIPLSQLAHTVLRAIGFVNA